MITQPTATKLLVLIATNDYGATHRYELKNDQGVFVGKSSNCGLQLHDNKLADIHCRIGMEAGKLRIQNWMSATGTLVNGSEITAEQELELLDVIQVGSHKIRIATSNAAADALVPESAKPAAKAPVAPVPQQDDDEDVSDESEGSLSLKDTDSLLESPTESLLRSEPDSIGDVDSSSKVSSFKDKDVAMNIDDDLDLNLSIDPESMDLDVDFFSLEEEETYDHETVALLQAEIDDLRTALAQRDADHANNSHRADDEIASAAPEASDEVLLRMQELIEEANRSDERAALLEEMLHAAEDVSRSERDERNQLEAWVRDIEKRIGQREEEHAAELDALKNRLQESSLQQERLQKKLRQVATGGGASANKEYEQLLESLQAKNRELETRLSESQKQCVSLEKRLASSTGGQEDQLRGERAKLAQEQAKISRLRYELSSKLAEIEQVPKASNRADQETGQRIRALREHLREIHEQEKLEVKESTLATRLASLWKRVEY